MLGFEHPAERPALAITIRRPLAVAATLFTALLIATSLPSAAHADSPGASNESGRGGVDSLAATSSSLPTVSGSIFGFHDSVSRPLPGALVRATLDVDGTFTTVSAKTDSDGRFLISLPQPGRYKISASATDYINSDGLTTVDASAGDASTDVTLIHESRITGRVTAARGSTLPDEALVELESTQHRGIYAFSPIGPDGSYTLARLPAGRYKMLIAGDASLPTHDELGWYSGADSYESATIITVGPDEVVTGVDATVGRPVPPVSASPIQSATSGGAVSVDVTGFIPGETLAVWLHSDPVQLGTLTADPMGAVRGSFTVPAGTSAGEHHVVLVASDGSEFTATTVAVTSASLPRGAGATGTGASSGTLAATGSNVDAWGVAAMLTLLAGAAFMVVARRRRAYRG